MSAQVIDYITEHDWEGPPTAALWMKPKVDVIAGVLSALGGGLPWAVKSERQKADWLQLAEAVIELEVGQMADEVYPIDSVGPGAIIRTWRDRNGLSLTRMSAMLRRGGVQWHEGALSNVEKGRRSIWSNEAPKVAAVLGIALSDLVGAKHAARIDSP